MNTWTWTCSKCGGTFTRPEKAAAQGAFFEHVTQARPTAIVLSWDGSR